MDRADHGRRRTAEDTETKRPPEGRQHGVGHQFLPIPSTRSNFSGDIEASSVASNDRFERRMMWLVDEARALACPVVGVLQTALPFQHGPAIIAVARQAIENAAKIDLAVADAAEASGTIEPILIAAIGPARSTWGELGVLDVKRRDPRMVAIDEAEIVHLLEQEMAGIVIDLHPRMMVDTCKKPLERRAVVQILPRVKFETQVDAGAVGLVEQRTPAPRQFIEGTFDQAWGSWRIGIKERPGQPA